MKIIISKLNNNYNIVLNLSLLKYKFILKKRNITAYKKPNNFIIYFMHGYAFY